MTSERRKKSPAILVIVLWVFVCSQECLFAQNGSITIPVGNWSRDERLHAYKEDIKKWWHGITAKELNEQSKNFLPTITGGWLFCWNEKENYSFYFCGNNNAVIDIPHNTAYRFAVFEFGKNIAPNQYTSEMLVIWYQDGHLTVKSSNQVEIVFERKFCSTVFSSLTPVPADKIDVSKLTMSHQVEKTDINPISVKRHNRVSRNIKQTSRDDIFCFEIQDKVSFGFTVHEGQSPTAGYGYNFTEKFIRKFIFD